MKLPFILVLSAACAIHTVCAAHFTQRLAPSDYEGHGFAVGCTKHCSDSSLVRVHVSGPLKKWGGERLAAIGFSVEQAGDVLVDADCSFREIEEGRGTAGFLIRESLSKNTTIRIVYGEEGGGTFLLSIPEEKDANTRMQEIH